MSNMSATTTQALEETGITAVSFGTIYVGAFKRAVKFAKSIRKIKKARREGWTPSEVAKLRIDFKWEVKGMKYGRIPNA